MTAFHISVILYHSNLNIKGTSNTKFSDPSLFFMYDGKKGKVKIRGKSQRYFFLTHPNVLGLGGVIAVEFFLARNEKRNHASSYVSYHKRGETRCSSSSTVCSGSSLPVLSTIWLTTSSGYWNVLITLHWREKTKQTPEQTKACKQECKRLRFSISHITENTPLNWVKKKRK